MKNTIILTEQVGFDVIKLNTQISYIDWDIFTKAASNNNYVSTSIAAKSDELLPLPNNTLYKNITISMPECKATLRLALHPSSGAGAHSLNSLELHVRPSCDYIGNLMNYTVSEALENALYVIQYIANNYGITINTRELAIYSAEINLNIVSNYDFSEIMRLLYVYRCSSTPDLTHSKYTQTNSITNETLPLEILSQNNHMRFKIYDKSLETIANSKDNISALSEKIIRVEFTLKTTKQVSHYFKDRNLVSLSQDELEQVFLQLVDKYYIQPLRKYESVRTRILEDYFSTIDINNKNWKNHLSQFLLSHEIINDGEYLLIDYLELDYYVQLIPAKSVKKNHKRITQSIISNLIRETKQLMSPMNRDIHYFFLTHLQLQSSKYGNQFPLEIYYSNSPQERIELPQIKDCHGIDTRNS